MRGPNEDLAPAAQRRPGPPGGKALERRQLFEQSRGITLPGGAGTPTSAAAARGATLAVRMTSASTAAVYAATAESLTAEEHSAPAGGPPVGIPSWRPLGPSVMHNGQTYGANRVDVCGRIAAIAVDPLNRQHILVGAAAGGIWETRDQGATWAPRTDGAATLTTGALTFDPSHPARVYCGTGEGNWYWTMGAGVLASDDGGTTWTRIASTPFVGQGFYDLAVDPAPANRSRLFAATSGGLFTSNNSGVAWTQLRPSKTWDISIAPGGGPAAEIFAACADGLYRSTNGTSYLRVPIPGSPATFARLSVAHAPSNPKVVWVLGATATEAFLWRRSAPGKWARIPLPADSNIKQTWYDWYVAASPDRDDQVYVGQIDILRGERVGTTWKWTNLSSKATGSSIHPDQHAIAFAPGQPHVVFAGSDGGIYRSTNRGNTWTATSAGLAITEIEYLAQDDANPAWLLAGTQDNGSIRYTGSDVWEHVADGDGGDCGVDQTSPTHVYHSFFDMGVERSTAKGDWQSFQGVGPILPDDYPSLFYPPLEVCGSTVAQAGADVHISRDRGDNWTSVGLQGGVASAMSMPTPGEVVVATTDGRLFRLLLAGTAWALTSLTPPRNGAWISDVHVAAADLTRIWVTSTFTGGGRVFRSGDGGMSWVDCSAGLPPLPINAVVVDPADANRVWVAADLGVYESRDAGATWTSFSTGLPNALVADLLFHAVGRLLRAGTRSRGAWEIAVGP